MTVPFDALLLAGGYGTRLRPLTHTVPKCLVEIQGKPLLEHWLNSLENSGCQNVLINTHHLASEVETFLKTQRYRRIHITSVHEPNLLGTLGTLRSNQYFFSKSINLIAHADNVCTDPLSDLIRFHLESKPHILLSMYSFRTQKPSSCGILQVDYEGTVLSYIEKPSSSISNLANSAIYCFSLELFDVISSLNPNTSDISSDLLPQLCRKMNSLPLKSYFADIGTHEALAVTKRIAPYA